MTIVDQRIKRRFPQEMKEKSFWLTDVEKSNDDSETIGVLIREISRLEHLLGVTSVILVINVMFTIMLVLIILISAFAGSGAVDMLSSGKQATGILKSLTGK